MVFKESWYFFGMFVDCTGKRKLVFFLACSCIVFVKESWYFLACSWIVFVKESWYFFGVFVGCIGK